MSALTLRLRSLPTQRVDMSPFTPHRLAATGPRQAAAIPLRQGGRLLPAGELFEVSGNDVGHIVIQSDSDRLDGIGTAMKGGVVQIEGQAGYCLGRNMEGGLIQVVGNAGMLAGSGMSGGRIVIEGSAGDLLGGPLAGERQAMKGGCIHVKGSAGDRAGDRQRRGIIVIEGDAGAYTASRMVAGTIVILGKAGKHTGLDMRRGSLLLTREPEGLPLTFNDNGRHELGFLTLLSGSLMEACRPLHLPGGNRVRRWVGDLACDGRGEILIYC